MPHITIKCLPKNLSESQFEGLVNALNEVAAKHLDTPQQFVSIDYQELDDVAQWKAFYKQEIAPRLDHLVQKPDYDIETL